MTMQTVPEQVRAAARATRDLAAQVGAIPLVEVPDLAETSLPGADSEAAAAELATAWRTRLDQISRVVDDHADKLGAAATAYQTQEQDNRGAYSGGVPR